MTITCQTAKDLIPLCVDDTASSESVEFVYEHIADCESCRKFYNECKKDKHTASTDNFALKVKDEYSDLSKRIKRNRNLRITAICILASLCLLYIIKDICKMVRSTKTNKGE